MFENAKVGERVCSYTYGWGEITDTKSISVLFPIEVLFESGIRISYSLSGRFDEFAINQDLFYGEIKVEIPESAKKPKVEWEFPCYGKSKNGMVVKFDNEGEGYVVIPGECDFYFHTDNWDMSGFTPCTLEAKEL